MNGEFQLYLGGDFCSTKDQLPVINPFTGKTIAHTYLAGKAELDLAIEKALEVKENLIDLPSGKKYTILMQIAAGLKDAREYFAEIIMLESGKPIRYALGEVDRAIQTFTVAAEETKRLPGEYLDIEWSAAGEGKEAIVRYFPLGLVAGIAPFNFPLNLAVHKLAPAIAAGCPIILKPSSSTPLTTLALARIINETDLPKGAVSILPMNRETGNSMVSDERFALLTFTGSPAVGWKMKAEAGKKKVVLELGGNAGLIVTESADLDRAVAKSLVGSFAYSGQVCIHTQRILVQEDVFDDFTGKFIKGVKSLKSGDPADVQTDISTMIDEDNAKRVEEWVQEAVEGGAKVLAGGKRDGGYFEPTVLTGTSNSMKVCSLEIFGPVVTIEKYKEFNLALEYINDSRYGLQAGVFTDKISEMNQAFRHLEVGGIMINDIPGFRVDHMPYGGVKDSGFGREGVKYSIHHMLEPRLLVKNR
ncbi:MAG: aldehyde dehydrogenase family protein [Bacteroidales bacterium]|jgi:glyceraldehyde-3-phosphate dehydrogenase (NADP+)|nr:aldehyde dehydrogenase family protein [Bacteroidales bacterium]